MSTKITYNGRTTELADGYIATLPCKDYKMETDVVVEAPEAVVVADSPLPTEVSTEAEMTALLTSGEVGGVYKYTGTTGTYENGALYVLEEEAEDELQGTWVFNNTIIMPSSYLFDNYSSWLFNFDGTWNSDNTNFYGIMVGNAYSSSYNSVDFCTDSGDNDWTYFWRSDVGFLSIGKTINITSKLSEVTNGEALLTWLKANATKQ